LNFNHHKHVRIDENNTTYANIKLAVTSISQISPIGYVQNPWPIKNVKMLSIQTAGIPSSTALI
jgi:hypothetical protein